MLKENSLKTNLKSIVFIANSSWYIFNFRKELLFNLKEKGYTIYIISPRDKYSSNLIDLGFKQINWDLNRSSLNLFSEFKSIFDLILSLKKIKVSLIHNFTMKGIIYGTIASIFVNKNSVINSITGLGHLFISEKCTTKILDSSNSLNGKLQLKKMLRKLQTLFKLESQLLSPETSGAD